eukprot:RCo040990
MPHSIRPHSPHVTTLLAVLVLLVLPRCACSAAQLPEDAPASHDVSTKATFLKSAAFRRLLELDPGLLQRPMHPFRFVKGRSKKILAGGSESAVSSVGSSVIVRGFQFYRANPVRLFYLPLSSFPAGDIMNPTFLSGRTVLDVGADNGAWSLAALFLGASKVTSLEALSGPVRVMGEVRRKLDLPQWEIHRTLLGQFNNGSADVVLAFGVLHFLTGHFEGNSLEYAVQGLRRVTKQVLLVQWRNPIFSWVKYADVRWHNRTIYTLTWFRVLLSRYFTDWAELGETHRIGRKLKAHFRRPLFLASVGGPLGSLRRQTLPDILQRKDPRREASGPKTNEASPSPGSMAPSERLHEG